MEQNKNNSNNSNTNVNMDFNKGNKGNKRNYNQKINKKNQTKNSYRVKKGETPVKVGSLLGLEQVGQCLFIEYKNDIIIIDAGLEFTADKVLGADYIIPDISYLKKKKHKIKGIVLTHGHLDHVGALKDILPELNYPTIYTTPLTLGITKKTFMDQKEAAKIRYKIIEPETELLKLGCFSIEFVRINHNIPETLAMAIHTPKGLIFNSADFKIDHTPAIDKPADLGKIARIGMEGVKLYIGDSLGSERPGNIPSEKVIGDNLDSIIGNTSSRMIIASFASNIGRVIQIVKSAIKNNKIIFLSGRSMVNNVEICQELGYLNIPKGMVRTLSSDVENVPDERVIILCTGSQGEEFSALARIARKEHNSISLKKGDTVLMSSSTIPGNESAVNRMVNDLVVQDINLITNTEMDVHTSGHGGAEDHKIMLSLLKPEYFMPYYTEASFRYAHKKLGLEMGIPNDNILMPNQNGNIIEMYDDEVKISEDEKIELDTVMIDGLGIGHLSGEYVMKARKIMAEDGMISLIFKVDSETKDLIGNVQIESRGFVYSSEVKRIHTNIVEHVKKKYREFLGKSKDRNVKEILKNIKEDLGEYLTKRVGRVPMVVPMFVYINRSAQPEESKIKEEEEIVGMTLEEQGGKNS